MINIQLEGTIFGSLLSSDSSLILDVRNTEKQTINYFQLDIDTHKLEKLSVANSEWWTKLISIDSSALYLTKYVDRNDPNAQVYLKAFLAGGELSEVQEIPDSSIDVSYPLVYELGTEHHKTVSDFLGLELPLSCEYFEWEQKIIISYYLRSGSEFDRFLLVLDNGKKEWKLHQDRKMKGFSPGAFFVHHDQLIFFKDLNEVCIYTL